MKTPGAIFGMKNPSFCVLCMVLAWIKTTYSMADPCTVTSYDQLVDSMAFCMDIVISNLKVPGGKTLLLTGLKSGASVTFRGKTTFGFEKWKGPLVQITGENLKIRGDFGHVLDGNGPLWWTGLKKLSDKGKNVTIKIKPKFMTFKGVNNSVVENLHIKNSPVHCFTFYSCHNITVSGITIDNSDGFQLEAHNTDGFNVGKDGKCRNVTIENSFVTSQGDCFSVNAGWDITFQNIVCQKTHGMSIGSVGGWLENEVDRIKILNCQALNTLYGIHVKTRLDATGYVSNVTFENITLSNIQKYGVLIHGNFNDYGLDVNPSDGVPISGLFLKNVTGSVESEGTNVFITVREASNWKWTDVKVAGGTKTAECQGIPPDSGAICSP